MNKRRKQPKAGRGNGRPRMPEPDNDSLSRLQDLKIGSLVDNKYRVLEKLGSGGFGSVYKVRHETLKKTFALKVLREDYSKNPRFLQRFEQEAKATATLLQHNNIVRIIGYGRTSAGDPYIVMQFLEGQDLDSVMRKKRLTWPQIRSIFVQVCDALAAAHSRGLVHRDVKPANIFLEKNNGKITVKLLDFGIAKMEQPREGEKLTIEGSFMGTPEYVSPEQAYGEREIDHRSDIYSVGIVIYELITGDVPFASTARNTRPRLVDITHQHNKVPPPPFSAKGKAIECPPGVEEAVMKAIAKKPEDRHQSMGEFKKAILSCEKKPEETSPMESQLMSDPYEEDEPYYRPPQRKSAARSVLVLAGIAALIGAGWYFLSKKSADSLCSGTEKPPVVAPAASPAAVRPKPKTRKKRRRKPEKKNRRAKTKKIDHSRILAPVQPLKKKPDASTEDPSTERIELPPASPDAGKAQEEDDENSRIKINLGDAG